MYKGLRPVPGALSASQRGRRPECQRNPRCRWQFLPKWRMDMSSKDDQGSNSVGGREASGYHRHVRKVNPFGPEAFVLSARAFQAPVIGRETTDSRLRDLYADQMYHGTHVIVRGGLARVSVESLASGGVYKSVSARLSCGSMGRMMTTYVRLSSSKNSGLFVACPNSPSILRASGPSIMT